MVKVLSVFLLCAIQLIYKNNVIYADDDNLEDLRCPKLNRCYTLLKYNVRYRCFVDEVCREGYKCCRSDCYIHKVCVVPVNNKGETIIPPPTTTVFTETTSEILTTITEKISTGTSKTTRFYGSGEGSGDTEEGDDESDGSGDIKTETTRALLTTSSERAISTTVGVEVTTFISTRSPVQSTYSGSGDDDERDDDEKDDDKDFDGSGNNEQISTSSISSSIVTKFTTHMSSTDLTTQKPKVSTPHEEPFSSTKIANEIGSGDDDEEDDDNAFDGSGDNKQIEKPLISSTSTFSTSKVSITDLSTLGLPTKVTPTEPRTSERTTTGLTTPLITKTESPSKNKDSEDGDTEDYIEFSGSGEEDKAEPPVTTSVVNITTAATTLTTIKPETSTLLAVTFSKLTTKSTLEETNGTDKPPTILLTTGTIPANLITYTASSLPTTKISPEVLTPLPTDPVETGSGDKERFDDDDRETDNDDFEFDGSGVEDKSKTLTSLLGNITKPATSTTKILTTLTTTRVKTSSLGDESLKPTTVLSTETVTTEDFKDDEDIANETEGSGSGDEGSSTEKSTVSTTESSIGLNIVTILSSSLSPSSKNPNEKVGNDNDAFKSTTYLDEIQLAVATNVTKFGIPTESTIKPESLTTSSQVSTSTPLELGSGYRNASEDDDEEEIEESKETVPSVYTTLKVSSSSIKSTEPNIDDDFKVEGTRLTSRSTDKELSTTKPVEEKSELSKPTSISIKEASKSFATPPSVTSIEYTEDDEDHLEGSGENQTTIGDNPEVAVTNLLSEENQATTQVDQGKLQITTNKLTVSYENTTSSLSTSSLAESDGYSSEVIDIDYDPSKDQKQPTTTTLTTKTTVSISEESDKLSTSGKDFIDSSKNDTDDKSKQTLTQQSSVLPEEMKISKSTTTSAKFDDSADLGSGLVDNDAEEGEGGYKEVQTKEPPITTSGGVSFSTHKEILKSETIKTMTTVGLTTSESETKKIDTKLETTVAAPSLDSSTGTSVKHESTATSTNKTDVPSSVKNPITPFNSLISSKQILDSLEEGSGNDYSTYEDDDFNHKT